MIRSMRDLAIFIFVVYALIVAVWARVFPNAVGVWLANVDVAYDSVWGEYISDCDCMEPLE